jgi:predicted secreted protein
MDWFTGIAIFLTMWWVVLFGVLPFGVRSQEESGEVIAGTDPGAPVVANIKKKLIWTTCITAVIWVLFALLLQTGWVSLEHPLGRFFGK